MILAITGGTGFVGSHLIDLALAEGYGVRALTRRAQPQREGITWIEGDLAAPGDLLERADAAIHVAGVVGADRARFIAGNIDGTRSVVAATQAAGIRRFVQVSSIAAREPALSDYGWSKAEADVLLQATDLDWTIVRPPAIFGPRDTELRELFRLARRHIVPLPPRGGRMSVIYVADLVRLLLTLATGDALHHEIVEPDDGTPNGWRHTDFVRAIGVAVGSAVIPLPLPRPLLSAAAAIDRIARGDRAKLTPDRVRYFCHPDWASHALPPPSLWRAGTPTPAALAATAAWYRERGLL